MSQVVSPDSCPALPGSLLLHVPLRLQLSFFLSSALLLVAMPVVSVTVHPAGLHPLEAVRAHHKWKEDGMSLDEIISEGEIVNLKGEVPGRTGLHLAIRRVSRMGPHDYLPISRKCCTRTPSMAKTCWMLTRT